MKNVGASISLRTMRPLLIVALLLVPVVTLWNVVVAPRSPKLEAVVGKKLGGVTEGGEPVAWSFHSVIDGSLQRAITDAVTVAIPVRPFLIRLSNSFRKRLFGIYGAPGVLVGREDELIEENYLKEYCRRELDALRDKAQSWIPQLRGLQDFFEAKGKQFVYLTSPSKVAHMPEKFVHLIECRSGEKDRRDHLPVYETLLASGGIRAVNAASMTHSLRGRYEVNLFPRGGVHWNQLGVAHAADAILAQINRRAGREIAPRLQWTYEITDRPTGTDTDLIDVANELFGRPRYPVPKLTFAPGRPCEDWPVSKMKIAFVGGSFVHDVARMLIAQGCMRGLLSYNYLYRSVRGGEGYNVLKEKLGRDDVKLLRDADIVILEENEAGLPGMTHARHLHQIILED